MKSVKVLFVCLGNICRSPTAHGVFQKMVDEAGLQQRVLVDSAGTSGWHIGDPPDTRATACAAQRGYDLTPLRGRQLMPGDFEHFDYILAMDDDNLANIEALAPDDYTGVIALFLSYSQQSAIREVPDPYYGGAQGFEHVLDLVEEACRGLLAEIQQTHL